MPVAVAAQAAMARGESITPVGGAGHGSQSFIRLQHEMKSRQARVAAFSLLSAGVGTPSAVLIKFYALSLTNIMVALSTGVRSPPMKPSANAVMRTIPRGWRR